LPSIADASGLAFIAIGPLFVSWVVIATTGYLLARVRWMPLRGKALDCVHYFYVLTVSLNLIISGVVWFEPHRPWFIQAFAVTAGVMGGALFVLGFISIVRRHEKFDRARAIGMPAENEVPRTANSVLTEKIERRIAERDAGRADSMDVATFAAKVRSAARPRRAP
jgi:hypothetical protein